MTPKEAEEICKEYRYWGARRIAFANLIVSLQTKKKAKK